MPDERGTQAGWVVPDGEASRWPRWVPWATWSFLLVAVTSAMVALREPLDTAHVALGLLLVVLGGSAAAGQGLGVALALAAFFAFNFFFLEPYHTLVVSHPLDWLVLAAFLVTGLVGARLLNRAQERATTARRRAVEVERLASLGAETLNAGRAEEALRAVLEVIRGTLRVGCCEIRLPRGTSAMPGPMRSGTCPGMEPAGEDDAWSLVSWVGEKQSVAAERADGTKWIGEPKTTASATRWPPPGTPLRSLFIPLLVRDRLVGVLCIRDARAFVLDPSQEQFLSALSYYAALGVERVALVAEADRAEAFQQADALKTALITGVSHDLRTPLTSIKALAHTLRERGSEEGAAIEEEADRLNRLVADLLDLSRLNAGAMPLRIEFNTAEDLVGAALRQLSPALSDRRITTGFNDGGNGVVLAGRFDFVQSLRALVNLVENAAKYSEPHAPIELHVTRRGNALDFTVRDFGAGVQVAERERIFEPFYRAPGARADVGGAGLGLAIARRLAVEQGGDVRLEVPTGGGSAFVLSLPAADVPSPTVTGSP